MKFDEDLLELPIGTHDAKLKSGAVIYRVTKLSYADAQNVLTGHGPLHGSSAGRWNEPGQIASYCADNLLTAITEVLFHMYRDLIEGIEKRKSYPTLVAALRQERAIAAIEVSDIVGLVNVDCQSFRVNFNQVRVCGTTLVFPDRQYSPFDGRESHPKK